MPDCCDDPPKYRVGNTYNLTGTFTDASGKLVDPAQVFAFGIDPTGAPVSFSVTRASLGVYVAPWRASILGAWMLTMSDANNDPTTANVTIGPMRVIVKAGV